MAGDFLTTAAPPAIERIGAVVFDCYGTLLDFDERAFAPALHEWLEAHGVQHVRGDEVWDRWIEAARAHAKRNGRDPERPLEGPEPVFHSFAETWPQFFHHAFEHSAIERLRPEDALDHMFQRLGTAPAYDEVHDVIALLRAAGLVVAVASNADDAHLLPALERAGIEADIILSSEGVKSYKPRRPFFDAVGRALELPHEQIIYVGDSAYADVTGAANAGMHAYWVRRYEANEVTTTPRAEPTWTFPDLRGLLELFPGGATKASAG